MQNKSRAAAFVEKERRTEQQTNFISDSADAIWNTEHHRIQSPGLVPSPSAGHLHHHNLKPILRMADSLIQADKTHTTPTPPHHVLVGSGQCSASASAIHSEEDTQSPPKASLVGSLGFARVQFKKCARTYRTDIAVCVGEHVVVEGDRGQDVGVVIDYHDGRTLTTKDEVEEQNEPQGMLIRRATKEEIDKCVQNRSREEYVLQMARTQTKKLFPDDTESLQINDAEFQHDGNKLTVYYTTKTPNGYVDFRKLQRRLHSKFKCRIWMRDENMLKTQECNPPSYAELLESGAVSPPSN